MIERGGMTLDIYKNRVLDGKSNEEIVKIFGEPDKRALV